VFLIALGLLYFGYSRWIKAPTPPEEDFQNHEQTIIGALETVDRLRSFLERQKNEVEDRNHVIARLKEEEGKIRPLVEADRATVSAILEAEAQQHRREIWFERAFSFLLGVLSSLVANWVWHRWIKPTPPDSGKLDPATLGA
jgi:hypothetical protein